MADRYGARFIEEVRRLTKSSFGYSFADVTRVSAMDRTAFWAAFGARAPFGDEWSAVHRDLEPEDLAKAVVAEAEVRAQKAGLGMDAALQVVFDFLA